MKIVFITSYLNSFLESNLSINKKSFVGIFEAGSRNYKPNLINNIFRIIFKSKLKKLAIRENLDYFFLHKNNQKDAVDFLLRIKPDLIIVYSMSHLLCKEIIEIPKLGIFNLHPSLLPKYRGPNPLFWTYYNQDKIAGITLHRIDQGEDTGDIIFQKEVKVKLGLEIEILQEKFNAIGSELIFRLIETLKKGELLPRKMQNNYGNSKRAYNLSNKELENIIDWENFEVERIWHIIKGLGSELPYISQPKGILYGQKWIVEDYIKIDSKNKNNLQFGKIYFINNQYILYCKDGIIKLKVRFKFNYLFKKLIKLILNFIKSVFKFF